MDIGIPTYYLASGLISGGMNLVQSMMTILLGQLIILIPILLNAHAGAKYGIPSPVYWRSAFGFNGASVAAVTRTIVSAGWFGIQIWIGGSALNTVMTVLFPAWKNFTLGIWVCFAIFWLMNIFILLKGMKALKILESFAAPFLIIWLIVLLIWAYKTAGNSFGPLVNQKGSFATFGAFMAFFIPSLTANVGYWGPMSLNVTEFTRYSKDQKSHIVGQMIGLPMGIVGLALVGSLVTSATVVIFGEAVWDPILLTGMVDNVFFVAGSMFFLMMATLSTNTAANALAPAIDIAHISGGKLNFKSAVITLGIVAILIQPWKLLGDMSLYMNLFLNGGALFLGPIAGICISNYFCVNKKVLNLRALYKKDGQYAYGGLTKYIKVFRNIHLAIAGVGLLIALVGPSAWLNAPCALNMPIRYMVLVYAAFALIVGGFLHLHRSGGVNPVAMLTLTVSVTVPFIGLWVPSLRLMYDACWFIGTGISVALYYFFMKKLDPNFGKIVETGDDTPLPANVEEAIAQAVIQD